MLGRLQRHTRPNEERTERDIYIYIDRERDSLNRALVRPGHTLSEGSGTKKKKKQRKENFFGAGYPADLPGSCVQTSRVSEDSGTENKKKKTAHREIFSSWISGGPPGVMRADVPGQKLRAGPGDLGKTSTWVRTSMPRTRGRPMTSGGCKKTSGRKASSGFFVA